MILSLFLFTFSVKYEKAKRTGPSSSTSPAAVVFGILTAILIVAIALAVAFVFRKHRDLLPASFAVRYKVHHENGVNNKNGGVIKEPLPRAMSIDNPLYVSESPAVLMSTVIDNTETIVDTT